MNKKVIAAGMAMVLASMGLTACGDSGSKEAKDSSDETYTVTMHSDLPMILQVLQTNWLH